MNSSTEIELSWCQCSWAGPEGKQQQKNPQKVFLMIFISINKSLVCVSGVSHETFKLTCGVCGVGKDTSSV